MKSDCVNERQSSTANFLYLRAKRFLGVRLYLVIFAVFLASFARPETLAAFFSGSTFEDRKAAYVNDQGRRWGDGDLMRAVWSWLEGERLGLPD